MKKLFILLPAVLLLCSGKPADNYPFDKWDSATLEKANTGKDASYLSDEEKKVVMLTNLARLKPDLFAKTYLAKYIDSAKTESTSFVLSLKNDLAAKYKPMEPLTVKQDLSEEASEHAKDLGKTGKRGSFNAEGKSFEFRMAKFKGVYAGTVENCDYGHKDALSIVISLLIDQDNANISSRRNMLDKNLKYLGVSIQPHKKDKWTCVMDFGK